MWIVKIDRKGPLVVVIGADIGIITINNNYCYCCCSENVVYLNGEWLDANDNRKLFIYIFCKQKRENNKKNLSFVIIVGFVTNNQQHNNIISFFRHEGLLFVSIWGWSNAQSLRSIYCRVVHFTLINLIYLNSEIK